MPELTSSHPQGKASPLAAPVTTGARPVAETLPKAVRRIVEALHPEKVILFGSHAYGKPTPDSDVDLLVILETSASEKERYLSVCRLLRPRPFPVDILVRTPQEVARATGQGRLLHTRNRFARQGAV